MRRLLDVDTSYYDSSNNETTFLYDSCGIFEYYLELLHRYYIPVMIFVGLIGNFLSCVVFLTTYLKLRSSSYYLAALAIADFSFLFVLTIVNFSYTGIMDLFNREIWCQVFVYISSVASILSVWLIVAFTVERFIAVQYPLQRPSICTVTRSKITVCVLSGVALASQCYVFWTAGVRKNENDQDTCSMIPEQLNAMKVINTIDCIITLIIPFLLIVVMNVMIAKSLYRFSKRMRNSPLEECLTSEKSIDFTKDLSKILPLACLNFKFMMCEIGSNYLGTTEPLSKLRECGGCLFKTQKDNNNFPGISNKVWDFFPDPAPRHVQTSTRKKNPGPHSSSRKSIPNRNNSKLPSNHVEQLTCIQTKVPGLMSAKTQQSISKMLLLISTVFIMLNLPSYAARLCIYFYNSVWGTQPPDTIFCVQQFAMILFYTNYSINFSLYAMYGVTFRRCLWQMLRNILRKFSRKSCMFK